ncbi:hypothetical protein ZEAMMB73_Zm00001d047301 [Zea mays]|uniref:Uncharacterized protein n=1 Tax=Zea mays TaxID=4577 RepID=A0A1D6P8H3_MAIZE|nr:hypothetical protein ZEAMMB73_Zm00001d047301 [Zea mays]
MTALTSFPLPLPPAQGQPCRHRNGNPPPLVSVWNQVILAASVVSKSVKGAVYVSWSNNFALTREKMSVFLWTPFQVISHIVCGPGVHSFATFLA